MTKRITVKDDDGPILNGHPVLSVEQVGSWFRAYNCNVSEAKALPIAQLLNEYEFVGSAWKDIPALESERRSPSRLRNVRIANALMALQAGLGH